MSRSPVIEEIEESYLKKDIPMFGIGDTIRVNTRIKEGNKERMQAYAGTVIAKKGTGLSETFTVYRTAYGSCMDRVFLLHSPRITSIEVVRPGKVRRAKLNYIRGKSGKSAKIKEQYTAAQAKEKAPKKQEAAAVVKPEVQAKETPEPKQPPKEDSPPTPTDETPPKE